MILLEKSNEYSEKKNEKSSTTSLSLALSEIRFRYELEEQRRQILESKAKILMGFIGVIVAMSSLFFGDLEFLYYNLMILPFFGLIGIALTYAFLSVSLEKKEHPHKKTKDFYQYINKDPDELEDEFLRNYITATKEMEDNNEDMVQKLRRSFIFTALSVAYLMGYGILFFIIQIVVG